MSQNESLTLPAIPTADLRTMLLMLYGYILGIVCTSKVLYAAADWNFWLRFK
jgi:hypothetical protein